jgi:hypothetical protein
MRDTKLQLKLQQCQSRRRGRFSVAELHWLLAHLADDTPTSVIQDIRRIRTETSSLRKEPDVATTAPD